VTHRVDALVHPMQPPRRNAMADRPASEAELLQLRKRHDAVLAGSEPRDGAIDEASATVCTDVVLKIALDSHASIVARAV
jgi:hypothetical protein